MEYQLVTPRDSMGFDLEAYVSFHMSVYQLMTLGVSNHKNIMVSKKLKVPISTLGFQYPIFLHP